MGRTVRLLIAVTALLTLAASENARWDWGTTDDEWNNNPEFASSKQICRAVSHREPPAADRPSPAQTAALKDCDSEALYYGIGMTADPAKARHCAFVESALPDDQPIAPFSGRTMLMTIYANGRGAARDLDVATHLACGVDGAAPYESHLRVKHLAELKAKGGSGSDFHFCDDITSGLAGGHCAGHGARIAEVERERALARIQAGWNAHVRSAFNPLLAAQRAYAEARGNGEVDMTGTLRGALFIAATEEVNNEFLEVLKLLRQGRLRVVGPTGYRNADRKLNIAYRAVLTGEFYGGPGSVTAAGVRQAQRAWLRYRDAFVAFAEVAYPNVRRDDLASLLTSRREALLKGDENGL